MPAKIVTICDELVTFLNGLSLSLAFTATRVNVWSIMLEETNAIRVAVIPQEVEIEDQSRDSSTRRFRVAVVVEKRITDAVPRDEQDDLLLLLEEIEDAIYGVQMGNYSFVAFNETVTSRQLIEVNAYTELGLFRTGVQVTYLGE